MNFFAKQISSLLLLSLALVWGAEALHCSIIPHFYCDSHQAFSHDEHDHTGTTFVHGDNAAEHACSEACDLFLFTHRGNRVVPASVAVSEATHVLVDYVLSSRSLSGANRFRFAPKNSPPV